MAISRAIVSTVSPQKDAYVYASTHARLRFNPLRGADAAPEADGDGFEPPPADALEAALEQCVTGVALIDGLGSAGEGSPDGTE